MDAEFSFKLGLLLGTLNKFLDGVCPLTTDAMQIFEEDIATLRELSVAVAAQFDGYEDAQLERAHNKRQIQEAGGLS